MITLTLKNPTTLAEVQDWMRMIDLLHLSDTSPVEISFGTITVEEIQ